MRQLRLAGLFFAFFIVAGCAGSSGSSEALQARQLSALTTCSGVNEAGAQLISERHEYAELRQRLAGFGQERIDTAPVRFAEEMVLFLSMGRRPTAGYALSLADPQITIDDGTARLTIRWQEPPPGSFQPQVITCPSLLVALPRASYDQIVVEDTTRKILFHIVRAD